MQIYVSGRQTGKTTRTIEWFIEAPDRRVVICIDAREADRLCRMIMECTLELADSRSWWGHNILWPEALQANPLRGRTIEAIWIDNIDLVLPRLVGYWGKIIATSTEPIEVINANPGD